MIETSTWIFIGAGLLVTGGCALAWVNFTADEADHKSIGRIATIGSSPRVAADTSPAADRLVRATGGRAVLRSGAAAFFNSRLDDAGHTAQPAALARGAGEGRQRRTLYVVK